MNISKYIKAILIIIGVGGVDQLSKYIIYTYYPGNFYININGTLGILPWWVSILSILILITILVINYIKNKNINQIDILFIMIISAGISNLYDRIIYGGVVDFIAVGNFPVFNIADVIISVGVGLLILFELKKTNNSQLKYN